MRFLLTHQSTHHISTQEGISLSALVSVIRGKILARFLHPYTSTQRIIAPISTLAASHRQDTPNPPALCPHRTPYLRRFALWGKRLCGGFLPKRTQRAFSHRLPRIHFFTQCRTSTKNTEITRSGFWQKGGF